MAKKLQSSLAVEGELPEDGLAAYGDDGDDLILALARKIVAGEEEDDPGESVFAQAQQVAADQPRSSLFLRIATELPPQVAYVPLNVHSDVIRLP